MAIEELNRVIVKSRARFEVSNNSPLPACPLKRTNKRFLTNTIKSAINFNIRKGHSTRLKSMKRLVEVEDRSENPESARKPEKFGDRQHIYKKKRKKEKKDREKSKSTTSSTSSNHHNRPDSDDDVIVLD